MTLEDKESQIFYEVYGDGPALIMLHGAGGDHHIFDESILLLKDYFKVYAVDLPGFGKSSNPPQWHYDVMADLLWEWIKQEDIQQPVIYGYDCGGIVALLIAIKHQEHLASVLTSGVYVSPDGLKKRALGSARLLYRMMPTPKRAMGLNEAVITERLLQQLRIPVHLTAGSKDSVKESHSKWIAKNIANATLTILTNETHGSYVVASQKIAYCIINTITGLTLGVDNDFVEG